MPPVRYVRVFADAAGGSHFDEIELSMVPVDFAPPAAPLDFVSLGFAGAVSLIAGDATWRGDAFHPAPARQLMLILRGGATVTVSSGETRQLGAGEIALLEDTAGIGHSTRFIGDTLIAVVRLAHEQAANLVPPGDRIG